MAKYFARSCPRCNGYVEIVMREPDRYMVRKAVNGHCVRCAYRLAWILIRGGRKPVNRLAESRGSNVDEEKTENAST
jgi:C4-type Zn-finger protein